MGCGLVTWTRGRETVACEEVWHDLGTDYHGGKGQTKVLAGKGLKLVV
jgi:hypothetical protein